MENPTEAEITEDSHSSDQVIAKETKWWLPNNNETWEQRLKNGEGKRVKFKYDFSSEGVHGAGIACPAETEGEAILKDPGFYKVKVRDQTWGTGWITVPELSLEFLK